MARRRNAARSIFHTAVGPERRVVDSPDIEPRIAMVPDEAWNWIEPAHVRKAAVQVPVDGRDRELAERETTILKAMAKATLTEQRELLAELNGIRAEKTARLAASRELDLANATVADHLTPIVSMGSRSTAKSDWLDDVPALTPGDMSHDMIVEAAMFWRNTHAAVKADVPELVEQAKGRARVVASRFEGQAPAARRIFMEEIVRLAAAHPAQEPAEDGVATSTLPVAINPSDAPETFDTNTLSDADREAIRDSQMADSDFAQKYQSVLRRQAGPAGVNIVDIRDTDEGTEFVDDKGGVYEVYGSKTAGAPTVMGPDQDLKNAPKAEQDAYWNWVGQMAADSDSGYYVPLSFRSWRSSYWSDEKGAPTYAPGMPPMASSRRKAVKIDDLRRIVENKQYENIDGMLVDGFTASAITQVFDALGPEAQQKYAQIIESDLGKASDIAFKLINKNSSRRTAADEPAQDGAAESTLPVAINPSDAPEGLDQLNENPQPATGMVGEGSGPAPQGAAAGGPTTFNDFVKDHTKAAAFRARVQSNLRRTAVSLTNVGLDGENGIGTDPSGNRIRFRLSPQDRKDLSSVLFSDLAINFSGVDVDESDIIREAGRRPFDDTPTPSSVVASTHVKVGESGRSHPGNSRVAGRVPGQSSVEGRSLRSVGGGGPEGHGAPTGVRGGARTAAAGDGRAPHLLDSSLRAPGAPGGRDALGAQGESRTAGRPLQQRQDALPQRASVLTGEHLDLQGAPIVQGVHEGRVSPTQGLIVREAADDWKQRQDGADAIAREMGISEGEMRGRVSDYIAEEVLGPDSGEGISSSDVNHTIYGLMYGGGEGLRDVLRRYASRKTAMPNPVDLGVKVGDIFVSTWGYDQTNVDFYEVVGLTGASVKVRPIASQTHGTPTLWAQRDVMPVPGQYTGEVMTKRIQNYSDVPSFTLSSYSDAYLWDGKPVHETSYA